MSHEPLSSKSENQTWFEHYVVEALREIKESNRDHANEFKKFRDEQKDTNNKIFERLAYQKGLNRGKLIVLILLSGGAGLGIKELAGLLLGGG